MSGGEMFEIAARTSPEIQAHAAGGGVLLVPVGSTEQHGPHLPVGTDGDIAWAVSTRLAARRPDLAVAPLIAYGSSGEHAGFAGTLSIGQEATELLLLELGRSAGETYSRQVFVSSHGGNAAPARRAVNRLRAESRDVLLWTANWDGDAHAGHTETSIQLSLAPANVAVAEMAAGNTSPIRELIPALMAGGVKAVSENGVLGDPAGANAQAGEELLEALAADLSARIDKWDAGPLGGPS